MAIFLPIFVSNLIAIALELQKVIRELLVSNNFISLPGLGSFVQSYQPAKLSVDGTSFLPPMQVVTFDPTRNFNDEAIENYLIDKYDFTRTNAAEEVKRFVDSVKANIEKGEQVEFDSVGTLKRNQAGQLVLEQADELQRASSTFGLKEVATEERKKPAHQTKATPKPTVVSPPPHKVYSNQDKKSRGALAGAVMGILILLAFASLFFFLPQLRFWEELSKPVAEVKKPEFEQTLVDSLETDYIEDVQSERVSHTDIKQAVAVTTDKKKALYYEEPQQQESKTYYIIAGSFEKLENAQVLSHSLSSRGYNPEIIQSDGRFRVAMTKYTDRNRALRELERLRREKPTEQVWLLGL